MKQLEKVFKGLANCRRLAIIRILTKNKELSVADIARHINLSFTSTSKHLSILHQLDILEKRQESLNVYYHLAGSLPVVVRQVIAIISNSRE
ncbi:MAG: metalloregulator ArsR/SmtB family transcription factor [bacterium]|nr:metalloregulator ArsR/SmtB family transcription factor [bacterium]